MTQSSLVIARYQCSEWNCSGFIRCVGSCLPNYTVSHLRRLSIL